MSTADVYARPGRNRLLGLLPPDEWARLQPHLEPVALGPGDPIYHPDEPIPYVYFPTTLIGSLVVVMDDGQSSEWGTVGNEGMIGLPLFLEDDSLPSRAFCQGAGEGFRMKAAAFREQSRDGSLHSLLHRYTLALLNQVAQSAACNRLHSFEERCARWLLMTHDRCGKDQFDLKQEFLAQMLGTRRATVSVAAGILQKAGFIRYTRGRITVVDREGLESAACECYARIHREYDRLLR